MHRDYSDWYSSEASEREGTHGSPGIQKYLQRIACIVAGGKHESGTTQRISKLQGGLPLEERLARCSAVSGCCQHEGLWRMHPSLISTLPATATNAWTYDCTLL